MAKQDATLGIKVHNHLKKLGIENPVHFEYWQNSGLNTLQDGFEQVCKELGLDGEHPSTEGTPHRLAKMYKNEICWGLDYMNFPACMIGPNDGFDEILVERNIEVKSLCEHHFMPVIGVAHVAYIPNEKLIGLSKLNRITEFFARRPQLQERLGQQILEALKLILDTEDVAVIIRAEHLCVKFRGIQDSKSDTVTSHLGGRFRDAPVRQELLTLIGKV